MQLAFTVALHTADLFNLSAKIPGTFLVFIYNFYPTLLHGVIPSLRQHFLSVLIEVYKVSANPLFQLVEVLLKSSPALKHISHCL